MTSVQIGKLSPRRTFRQGIHPPHRKGQTAGLPVRPVGVQPGQLVVVPMSQHLGAPCEPTVEAKQQVVAGQEVGVSKAFVSAPVHSPINGVIQAVSPQPHPGGSKVLSVVITAGEQQRQEQNWQKITDTLRPEDHKPEAIASAVRKAGIVGMGGAAFPTAVKLAQNPLKPIDTVILNGCECEPYLTSDHRLMLEAPGPMVMGLRLALQATGAKKGIIAIEDNKPDAIAVVREQIKDIADITLAVCETKYPQGGEKQLIIAVLSRGVPMGGLPLDVGVVVVNAGTAAAIAWACAEGRPVTKRIVTVTGAGIKEPGNFLVPVGMLLSNLIERCGGLTDDAARVLLGGPMMGPTAARLDIPILKGTSGITIMTADETTQEQTTACIRCSRCVDYCPVRLVPTRIAHAVKARDIEMALDYDLMGCCECGSCSYVCPSHIPLLQYIRAGKEMAKKVKS